jgi:HK97 family phage portal protein
VRLTRWQRARLAGTEIKQAVMRFFLGIRWSFNFHGRTPKESDMLSTIGEGRNSSLIVACLATIITAFLEPRLRVVTVTSDGNKEIIGHKLTTLLRRPNPFYSGLVMWTATLLDWFLTGNAYWIKVRDNGGLLLELWWVPSYMIQPKWPDDKPGIFLTHYEYKPNPSQDPINYDIGDIVHFRNGIDPENPRKGLSPIAALFRLVFTDEQAIAYQSVVLANGGAPGMVIAPAAGGKISDPDRVKAEFEARVSGDNRGRPLVMSSPITVTPAGYSPAEMNLDRLNKMPETRVAALFGSPAVVVGLSAGLDHSTYNNMGEAREHLYEGKVIPTHNFFKEELWAQLLPEFEANIDTTDLEYDYSKVRVLQEDRDKLYTRVINAWINGLITRAMAKTDLGYKTEPTDDIYAVPGKVKLLKEGEWPVDNEPVDPNAGAATDDNGDPIDEDGNPLDDNGDPIPPAKAYPIGETKQAELDSYFNVVMLMHAQEATNQIGSYLAQQRDEVIRRYRESAAKSGDPSLKVSIGQLLPFNENARSLRGLMTKWYVRVADDVHTITQDLLATVYEIPRDEVEEYAKQAGYYVTGITRTTRNDVAKILRTAIREKWTTDQTAQALYEASAFSTERAETIARTELGSAANLSAIVSYENSGRVESVNVFDGDEDAVCAAWNGRIVPLDNARSIPRLAHPNCTRSFSPNVAKASVLPTERVNGHREIVHA